MATRSDRVGTAGGDAESEKGASTGGDGSPDRPATSGNTGNSAAVDHSLTGVVAQVPGGGGWWQASGTGEHLRPFSQTAQVPVVPGGYRVYDRHMLSTGQVPRHHYRRYRAPLGLLVAVWLVVVLILVAGAGVVVHKYRPSWLRSLEVTTGATSAQSSGASSSGSATTSGGSSHATAPGTSSRTPTPGTTLRSPNGMVVADMGNPAAVTVSVASAKFTVGFLVHGNCWVSVSVPGRSAPIFAQVVPPGADTWDAVNGALSLDVGASPVTLEVLVNNKVVPGWQFVPSAAPFTISFHSVPSKH